MISLISTKKKLKLKLSRPQLMKILNFCNYREKHVQFNAGFYMDCDHPNLGLKK